MILSKRVFIALTSVAWADGEVSMAEATAVLKAARAAGLCGADLADVARATKTKVHLDDIAVLSLDPDERRLVFGLAVWIAKLDGVVFPAEQRAVDRLADLLGLSEAERRRAAFVSSEIAADFLERDADEAPLSYVARALTSAGRVLPAAGAEPVAG